MSRTEDPRERPAALRVALLGCGTVGGQVARLLLADAESLAARAGARLELAGIAVRRPDRHRRTAAERGIDPDLFTADAEALVDSADVVVEVIGGIEPARRLVLRALRRGASVVTANKALLAEDGATLYAAARESGASIDLEAAVAGTIPILRPLRDSLAGDQVHRILGIVNGTTNFVLDRMDATGAGFADAVAEAQQLGYAEADSTADVEGFDAAAKAAILATLAFHSPVTLSDVHREGITGVTAADVTAAREAGYVVKLLAIVERVPDPRGGGEGISVRVHPALVPTGHPLAGVREAFNAVFVEAESAGSLMFYGQGAGGAPTASAVLGDLVSVARRVLAGGRGVVPDAYAGLPVLGLDAVHTRYQVSLDVTDRPGVLASVAKVFAGHGVSIETVRQRVELPDPETLAEGESAAPHAVLVVSTHLAADTDLSATVEALAGLDAVKAVTSVLRIEGV